MICVVSLLQWIDQGFWSQETLDSANQGASPIGYHIPPPPDAFTEGTTQFNINSDSYIDWRDTKSGMKDFIEDAVKDYYGDYLG